MHNIVVVDRSFSCFLVNFKNTINRLNFCMVIFLFYFNLMVLNIACIKGTSVLPLKFV